MKRYFYIILLSVLALSCSHDEWVGTYWHNGNSFYTVVSEDDTSLTLWGGNMHEGGWRTCLYKTDKKDCLAFCNNDSGIADSRDSLVHTFVDGREVVLQYASDGSLKEIWRRYEGRSDNKYYEKTGGFDTLLLNDMRMHIEGSYVVEKDTNALYVLFFNDSNIINFIDLASGPSSSYGISDSFGFLDSNSAVLEQLFRKGSCSYRWLTEFDFPVRAIQLDNGCVLAFDYIPAGLIVYNAKYDDEADEPFVEKGAEAFRLLKYESVTGTTGFYPEGSQCLLTMGYLENYPLEVLRLMRNDIYARHGYEFKDPESRALYEAHGFWYQPSDDGMMTPLTATEKLNIELISAVEKRKKQCQ